MKYPARAMLGLAALACAKEMPKDLERAKMYDSGAVHDQLMGMKYAVWDKQESMGVMNSLAGEQYPELHFAQCRDGKAIPVRDEPNNFYRCNNVSAPITKARRNFVLMLSSRLIYITFCRILLSEAALVRGLPLGVGCPTMVGSLLLSLRVMERHLQRFVSCTETLLLQWHANDQSRLPTPESCVI
jgi:hypothetical protein